MEAASAAFSSDLADRLSPSQVSMFTDCSAKWWFRYGLNLPDPRTGNMALGTAVHESLAFAFECKMDSGKDLTVADVTEQFDVEWKAAQEEAELRDDESPSELRDAGRRLVGMYMREAAPAIDPAAVELDLIGVIGGVKVAGVVDLVERNGRIRDYKTGQKRTGLTNENVFQCTTYKQLVQQARESMVLPKPSGLVQIDSLIRTKTPQYVPLPHQVTQADIEQTERMYPLVQEAMRAGYFVPNRKSNLCSRRNCSFWRACEREFGGRVQ